MRTSQIRSSQRGTVKTLIVLLIALVWPSLVAAQGTLMPVPVQVFLDNSGDPINGGKLCTYAAGTSTPQATYSDQSLSTSNTNPVILNSAGRPTTGGVYLSATSYKFILLTAGSDSTCDTGTTIWTQDNVSAIPATAVALDVTGTAGEALSAGEVVYLSDGSGSLTAGRWYLTDADNTYSSSTAGTVGIVPSAISSGASGTIRVGGRVTGLSGLTAGEYYYASATAGGLTGTPPTNQWFVGKADTTTSLIVSQNEGAVRLPDSDGTHTLVLKTTSDLTADRLFTLVPGDAARTLTLSGDPTLSDWFDQSVKSTASPTFADITFSGGDLIASADATFRRSTSDGSDNGSITVAGAGAAGSARGATVVVAGNEHATAAGDLAITLGNATGAQFIVANDGGNILAIDEDDGAATFSSSAATAWAFRSTATNGSVLNLVRSGVGIGQLTTAAVLSIGTSSDLAIKGETAHFYVEAADEVRSLTIYGDTAADAANVFVQSDGTLGRSTSSARYKFNIAPLVDWRFLLDLEPITSERVENAGSGRRYASFIAEQVAVVNPMFVAYDGQGRPDEVAYTHLTVPLTAAAQAHEDRLNKHLDLIAGIEARLRALEAENAELRARLGLQ